MYRRRHRYLLTDCMSADVKQSVVSVRPFVATLSFEPTDLELEFLYVYGS